ncbi:WG repeat-containing protein [Marinigracilibium pacificum]|uniref:WG repeat-containing protein n=1 Tax=Marinigracilibium pacificum TaxID=2729599 RepID=A0A848J4V0_9BACT|nr:WG repeat-containing protein [Marinigracilibium pacificum]NMM50801.1 WG repeat-containing protein [Marinigracilibium pacificum]
MNKLYYILILSGIMCFSSCKRSDESSMGFNFEYYNIQDSEIISKTDLIAVTDEDYLQFGARVAYINNHGDTIIPLGRYSYYGTDTLKYFANVIEHPNDSTWGRMVAIDRNQNILFDLVMFDNGPEPFKDGMLRVSRNGKMGFANKFGQVVIPCDYEYARWFENGIAEVTFDVKEVSRDDEHSMVESDEWFEIDKKGEKLN